MIDMNQIHTGQNLADRNQNLKRRGFVTTALGAGVFMAASHSMAQTSGEKPGGKATAKTLPHNKVFIALPGDRYYAIPEEALAPFKVEQAQFDAELAQKHATEPKQSGNQDSAGPQAELKSAKSALTDDQATETGMTVSEVEREIRKRLQKQQVRTPAAVLGVRG